MKSNERIYKAIMSNVDNGEDHISKLAKLDEDDLFELLSNKLHSRVSMSPYLYSDEKVFLSRIINLKSCYRFSRLLDERNINEKIINNKSVNKSFLLKYIRAVHINEKDRLSFIGNLDFDFVDYILKGFNTNKLTSDVYKDLNHFVSIAAFSGWIEKDIDRIMRVYKIRLKSNSSTTSALNYQHFLGIFFKDVVKYNYGNGAYVKKITLDEKAPTDKIRRAFAESEDMYNQLAMKITSKIKAGDDEGEKFFFSIMVRKLICILTALVELVESTNKNENISLDDKIRVNVLESSLQVLLAVEKRKEINGSIFSYFADIFARFFRGSLPLNINVDPKFIIDNFDNSVITRYLKLNDNQLENIIKNSKVYIR